MAFTQKKKKKVELYVPRGDMERAPSHTLSRDKTKWNKNPEVQNICVKEQKRMHLYLLFFLKR